MISALSLCPMNRSSHFLNNHSPSLFSWMDVNTNQSLFSVWSRGLVSRRKPLRSSLLRLVQHDMETTEEFKKRKNTGFLF